MLKTEDLKEAHLKAKEAALDFKIKNSNFSLGNFNTNFLANSSGSSIEYNDHRQYHPGDDPRYLDWKAYARTDSLIMKEFQKEIAPYYEIVLDVSFSMFFKPEKMKKSLELLYFNLELALQAKLLPRVYFILGEEVEQISIENLLGYIDYSPKGSAGNSLELRRIQFKQQSLRVMISDLLFLMEPNSVLVQFTKGAASSMIYAPFLKTESSPEYSGVLRLRDCEQSQEIEVQVNESVLKKYLQAYKQHFLLWEEEASKYGVSLLRVESEEKITSSIIKQNLGFLYKWQ